MHYLIMLIITTFVIYMFKKKLFQLFTNVAGNTTYYHKKEDTPIDITNESMIACRKCGKFHQGDAAFCPYCGVKINED